MSDTPSPPPVNWLTCDNPHVMACGLPRAPAVRPPGWTQPYSIHSPELARRFRLLAAGLLRLGFCGAGRVGDAAIMAGLASLLDGRLGFGLEFDWEQFDQHVEGQLLRLGVVSAADLPLTQVRLDGGHVPYYRDEVVLTLAGMMSYQEPPDGGPRPAVDWVRPAVMFRRARGMTGLRLMLDSLMRRDRSASQKAVERHWSNAAGLIRCVFRTPAVTRRHNYEPLPEYGGFEPKWRSFNAVYVARGILQRRDWESLPILADALQDEGCEDETVMGHLRGPGPHCRGCWALDAVIGAPGCEEGGSE